MGRSTATSTKLSFMSLTTQPVLEKIKHVFTDRERETSLLIMDKDTRYNGFSDRILCPFFSTTGQYWQKLPLQDDFPIGNLREPDSLSERTRCSEFKFQFYLDLPSRIDGSKLHTNGFEIYLEFILMTPGMEMIKIYSFLLTLFCRRNWVARWLDLE